MYNGVVQAELIKACQEYDVPASGTKEQLVSNLLACFSTQGVETSAVKSPAVGSDDDIQLLTKRVSELDSAIQTRTEELQSLHDGDRCTISFLTTAVLVHI
jgi:hypothetical protein